MKKYIFSFLILLIAGVGGTLFAQNEPVPTSSDTPSFISNLDAPQLIKNNVRAHTIKFTKVEINSINRLEVEGTVQITNYADTASSRLYMTSYVGISGEGYYLQYPLYTDKRSEAFVLEPNQTVTRDFKITEENFLKWGLGGVEILIEDEYNRLVHKEVSSLPLQNIIQIKQDGELFTSLTSNLVVGEKKFPPPTGPTFYPNTEEMFLDLDFQDRVPDFIDDINISIYNRNFFTHPVQTFTAPVEISENNTIQISIPKNLSPGVYPVQVQFSTNNDTFIPRVYGRFIVGGNMGKTTDIALNLEKKKVPSVTVVVQGNPPDITNRDREEEVVFDAEIIIFNEQEEIIFSQKLENQKVEIYKNLDIAFKKSLKASDIKKIQVLLSDENGVFDTYEKDFDIEYEFNYLNLLYVLGGILILLLLIKIKYTHKDKFVVGLIILFAVSGVFIDHKEVLSKTVSDLINTGGIRYAGPSIFSVYESGQLIDEYEVVASKFKAFENGDNLLNTFGIDVTVLQPNPNTCYVKGEAIPLEINVQYNLCSNSPVLNCDNEASCSEVGAVDVMINELSSSVERFTDYVNIRSDINGSVRYLDGVEIFYADEVYLDPIVNLTQSWLFSFLNHYSLWSWGLNYMTVSGSDLLISNTSSGSASGQISRQMPTNESTPSGLNVVPMYISFDIKPEAPYYELEASILKEIPVLICDEQPPVDFSATCASSSAQVYPNDEVTFTITTTGSDGAEPVYYSWSSGASELATYSTSYDSVGVQSLSVPVSNGLNTTNASCSVEVIEVPPPPPVCDDSKTPGQIDCNGGQEQVWSCTSEGWQSSSTGNSCPLLQCFANPSSLIIADGETETGPVTFSADIPNTITPETYSWRRTDTNAVVSTSYPYEILNISEQQLPSWSIPLQLTITTNTDETYISPMCSVSVTNNNIGGSSTMGTPDYYFSPTIATNDNGSGVSQCPLVLNVQQVTSCTFAGSREGTSLIDRTFYPQDDETNINITTNGPVTENLPAGTWALSCIDSEGIPVPFERTISCISNPSSNEF